MSFDSKKLENKLIIALRPSFIGMEEIEGILNVVICCKSFNYLEVSERVQLVNDVIYDGEENLINEKPVIIQAFNEEEMDGLLETILL